MQLHAIDATNPFFKIAPICNSEFLLKIALYSMSIAILKTLLHDNCAILHKNCINNNTCNKFAIICYLRNCQQCFKIARTCNLQLPLTIALYSMSIALLKTRLHDNCAILHNNCSRNNNCNKLAIMCYLRNCQFQRL